MTTWVDTFAKIFDTRAATPEENELKQQYAAWVQANGSAYINVKNQAPVLFELLGAIEDAIHVKVKIQKAKEEPSATDK